MNKIVPLNDAITVYEREQTNDPEPLLTFAKEDVRYCPHNRLNVFKHHRKVHCKDCGATLDAFDCLVSFTDIQNIALSNIRYFEYQVKQRQEEKENLEKEIGRLKAVRRSKMKAI